LPQDLFFGRVTAVARLRPRLPVTRLAAGAEGAAASSIPITVFITLSGWVLCLILAELAAMMPERTGGSPSYAYPAFKDRWPRFAKHINGFTAWAYWLGWFPVAPLNMILASFSSPTVLA
jgi:amino acid transporter